MNASEKTFAVYLLQAPIVSVCALIIGNTGENGLEIFADMHPARTEMIHSFLYSFFNLIYFITFLFVITHHLFFKKILSPIKIILMVVYPIFALLIFIHLVGSVSGPGGGAYGMGMGFGLVLAMLPASICSLPLLNIIRNVHKL